MNHSRLRATAPGMRRRVPLPALTSLRFLAAIYVVLFHLAPATTYPFPFDRVIEQGRAGVAFFFILSGFILTYNYADWFSGNTSHCWRFYQARLARVYPMYVVGLLLCTPLTLYFLSTSSVFANRWFGGTVTPVDVGLTWLVNLLALQAFVPVTAFQYFWNAPGWSIGVEFFFYALFPFLARRVLTRLRTPRALLVLLASLCAVQVMVWLMLTLWIVTTFDGQAYHDAMDLLVYKPPIMRLPEFLVGCALGALYLQALDGRARHPLRILLTSARWRNAALVLGLLGCVAVVLLPTPGSLVLVLYPMKFFVLFTPVFALLILTIATGPTFVHRVLEHRWAVLLGEASYSLYIIHGSVRMVLVDSAEYPARLPLWVILTLIAAIVVASIGFYHFLEVPARHALRPGSRSSPPQPGSRWPGPQRAPDIVLNPISTVDA